MANALQDIESLLAGRKESTDIKAKEKGRNRNSSKTGIKPDSPKIYLLPQEKEFVQRLKAAILLESGKWLSDHELVMTAIDDYAEKHMPDFFKTYNTKLK